MPVRNKTGNQLPQRGNPIQDGQLMAHCRISSREATDNQLCKAVGNQNRHGMLARAELPNQREFAPKQARRDANHPNGIPHLVDPSLVRSDSKGVGNHHDAETPGEGEPEIGAYGLLGE